MVVTSVSIITPVYNSERFVTSFLDNIFAQTYGDIELIIVDDGSQDGTASLIDELVKRNHDSSVSVKLLKQQHVGPGAARQLGIKAAKGDFLFFADVDDVLHPQLVASCVFALETSKADFVYFDYLSVKSVEKFDSVIDPANYSIISSREYGQLGVEEPEKTGFGYLWNKMFRASRIYESGIEFLPIYTEEDAIFLLNLYAKCHTVAHIPAALYQYVHNPVSITHSRRDLGTFADNVKLRCDATYELLTQTWGMPNNSLQSRVFIRYIVSSIELLLSERGSIISATKGWNELKKSPYFSRAIRYNRKVPRLSTNADRLVMLLVNMKMDLLLVTLVKLIGRHE